MRRHTRLLRGIALAIGCALLAGADCRPPPPAARVPRLLDETGRVDEDAFDALVAAVEQSRGRSFIRRPTLVTGGEEDPERARLAEALARFEPMPGATAEPPSALPDFDRARVVSLEPPDPGAVSLALARLLDEQSYPRLVALAPTLSGDGGFAVRALLRASAELTAHGGWSDEPFTGEPLEIFSVPSLQLSAGGRPAFDRGSAWSFASVFLLQRDDREAPFRRPPLSSKQLLSARAYEASDRPLLLRGVAPMPAGCRIASDESLGVAPLLLGAASRGAAIEAAPIGAWKGDRLVRYACDGGSAPWLYVAEVEREEQAAAFRAALAATLPPELGMPDAGALRGRRIALSSGLASGVAEAFAVGLAAQEVKYPEQLPGLGEASRRGGSAAIPPHPTAVTRGGV